MPADRFDSLVVETGALAAEFLRAGKRVYLVGGIVRDTLLGRARAELDLDLTTDALPDEIESILQRCRPTAMWTQGKRFGTVGATINGPNGPRAVEITTHRAEQYHDDSRKPEVRFSTDITLDLSRRDFTVNAMAFDLANHELLDPFGGERDLADRVLRTPLSPDISFRDDPLRMLRAARFVAALGLTADPALHDAVIDGGHRMSIVSAERVRGELEKLLALDDPAPGLRFLASSSLMAVVIPELAGRSVETEVSRVARVRPWLVRLAALLWDGCTSEQSARKRLRALKCSSDEETFVGRLFALRTIDLPTAASSDGGTRRFLRTAGEHLDAFRDLVRADCEARLPSDSAVETLHALRSMDARAAALAEVEDLKSLEPELDGDAVMGLLGLAPGRSVGKALAYLLSIRLDEGVIGRAEAERRLRLWWEHREDEQPAQ